MTTQEALSSIDNVEDDKKLPPILIQFNQCKIEGKGALLLFRVGDFYETYNEDAKIIAKELELTLTKKMNTTMTGVPSHTLDIYVDKLIAKGFKVAIAEQIDNPKDVKGIVRRKVVRIITPGTLVSSGLLSDKTNNFIISLSQVGSFFGLAIMDISTGCFSVMETENENHLLNEIAALQPTEIVISKKISKKYSLMLKELELSLHITISVKEDWCFEHKICYQVLTDHFKVASLDGFGLRGMISGINSGGGLFNYLKDDLSISIAHIKTIKPYSSSEFMIIDRASRRHLLLNNDTTDNKNNFSLLKVLDTTLTPAGGRLLKENINKPFTDIELLNNRLSAVELFFYNQSLRHLLRNALKNIRDLERLMTKISSGYATPPEICVLKSSLAAIPEIKALALSSKNTFILNIASGIEDPSTLIEIISTMLEDEPNIKIVDGNVIKSGFNKELDELRYIANGAKTWINNYQEKLRQETGIKTLKVGYNRMVGYFIEAGKIHSDILSTKYQRRQTLTNSERFISEELKAFETKALTVESQILTIETMLFKNLCDSIKEYEDEIFQSSKAIALLDLLSSLAETAKKYDYTKPSLDNSKDLKIINGRHPIVEFSIGKDIFIPNDVQFDEYQNKFIILTGPNMAGKSTYARQIALISIMAQIGSFVPADICKIGIIDQIFTRIGAGDDLSAGKSTFMVEMNETANILNNATSKSLVILDEIGRGTGTYDGVAIAWAVAEYLLTTPNKNPKTLFATHYWELTELEKLIPGAINYHAAVKEQNSDIIFLHKIKSGIAEKSYGIHVAKLAGLPNSVINRADEILQKLEKNNDSTKIKFKKEINDLQLRLF